MTGQDRFGFTLYHVYFNGLKRDNLESNFLLTYDGKKAPGLEYLQEHGHKGKLFMDSGAYPAYKKNSDLDIDKYIDYVCQVHQYFTGIAQLDYIPRETDGTPEQRQAYSTEETWRRYLYMWERVPKECRHKLIYIVHEHEDIEPLLERALAWRDKDGQGIGYLGVGLSTPNKRQRMHQLAIVNKLCKKYQYSGNLHAFGVQQLDLIQQSDYITSSDSSSAIRDQMRGFIFVDGRQVKVSDDTKVHHKSDLTQAQNDEVQAMMRKRAEALNIDYDLAKEDAQERYLWGIRERDKYFNEGYKNKRKMHKGSLI